MKLRLDRFKHYLLVCLLGLLAGCASSQPGAKEKQESVLQLFLEADFDEGDRTAVITVCRATPVAVRIHKTPFLDNSELVEAALVDAIGGFVLQLRFTSHGALVLEQATIAHRGGRLVIYAMFPNGRWLAAPMFPTRISDGVLTFTPDATREEAERLVRGLNNVAVRLKNKPKPGSTKKQTP